MTTYDAPVPFAPLTPTEALLRYGETCRAQAMHFERAGICEPWRQAARDADALHWRVHMALKVAR